MKKRKLILIHLILLVWVLNINDFVRADNQLPELNATKIEELREDSEWQDDNKDINKWIYNVKTLKKEIQNKKKYHKNLISMYNISFDNHYLDLIKENSLQIQFLEKLI